MLIDKEKLVKKEEMKLDIRTELDKERVDYVYSLKRAGYFGNFLLEGRVTAIEEEEDRGIFRCEMTLDPMGSQWIDFAKAKYRPKLFEVFLIRSKDWNNNAKWHCFIWDELSKRELAKKEKEKELEIKKNLDVYHVDHGHYEFLDQENRELLHGIEVEGERETSREKFDSFIRRNKPLRHGDGRRHKILQRDQYETLGLFKNYFGFSCFEEQNITPFLSSRKVNFFRFKFRNLSPLKYCFPAFNRNVSFFLLKRFFGFSKIKKSKLQSKLNLKLQSKLRVPKNIFMYQTIRFLPVHSSLLETKVRLVGTKKKRVLLNSSRTFSFVSAWLSWKFLFTCVVLKVNKDFRAKRSGFYSLSKISQLRSLLKINRIFKDGILGVGYYDCLRKLISLPIQRPFDAFVIGCCINSENNVSFSFSQFGYSHRFRTYFLEPRKRTAKPLSSIVSFPRFNVLGRPSRFFRYSSKLWLSTFVYRMAVKNLATIELIFANEKNQLLRWVDPSSAVPNGRFAAKINEETFYVNRLHNVLTNFTKNGLLHKVTDLFKAKRGRVFLANKKKLKLFNELKTINWDTYKNKPMLNKKYLLNRSMLNKHYLLNKPVLNKPVSTEESLNKLKKKISMSKNFVPVKKTLVLNQPTKKRSMFRNQTVIRNYSFLAKPKVYDLAFLRRPVRVSLNFLEKSLLKSRVVPRNVPLDVCNRFLDKEKSSCLKIVKLDSMSYLARRKSFLNRYFDRRGIPFHIENSKRLIKVTKLPRSFKVGILRKPTLVLPWFLSSNLSKEKKVLPRLRYLSKSMYMDLAIQKFTRLQELRGLKRDILKSLQISKKWARQNKKNSKYTTNPYWSNRNGNQGKSHPRWRDVTFGSLFRFPQSVFLSIGVNTKTGMSPSMYTREARVKRTYPRRKLSYRTRFVLGKKANFFYTTAKSYQKLSFAGRYNSFMSYLRIHKFYDKTTAYPMVRLIAISKEIDKQNTKNWEEWNRIKQTWYAYKKQQRKQRKYNNFRFGKYKRNFNHNYNYKYNNNNNNYNYKHNNNNKHNNYKHSFNRNNTNITSKNNNSNNHTFDRNNNNRYDNKHKRNFNYKHDNKFRGQFDHRAFDKNNQSARNTHNNVSFKHASAKINGSPALFHKQKSYENKSTSKAVNKANVKFTKNLDSRASDKFVHQKVDRRRYKDLSSKYKHNVVHDGALSSKVVDNPVFKRTGKSSIENTFKKIYKNVHDARTFNINTIIKSNSKTASRDNRGVSDTNVKQLFAKDNKRKHKISANSKPEETKGVRINLSRSTKGKPVQKVTEGKVSRKLENRNINKKKSKK